MMFGPNITGSFTVYTSAGANQSDNNNEASGAFSLSDGGGNGESYKFANHRPKWSFSAARSSSLFGGSSSVQPPSLRLLPCIKI